MIKKLKYLMIIIVSIIICWGIADICIAENDTFSANGSIVQYNGRNLHIDDLSYLLSENQDFVGKFLNSDVFLNKYLSVNSDDRRYAPFESGGVKYRAGICWRHDQGNRGSANYLVTGQIEVKWDEAQGKMVAISRGEYGEKEVKSDYATELSYVLYLNQAKGIDYESSKFKDYIVHYLNKKSEVTNKKWINYPEEFDSMNGSVEDRGIGSEYEQELKNYTNELQNYKKITKVDTKGELMERPNYDFSKIIDNQKANYRVVGPFKMEWGGTALKEKGITVNGTPCTLDKNSILYTYSQGKNKEDYKDPTVWSNKCSDIKSGHSFFLAIRKNYLPEGNKDYKIVFNQKPVKYYRGKILFLESAMRQQNSLQASTTAKEESEEAFVEYKVRHIVEGKITIQKVDRETKTAIKGVQLKIYGVINAKNKGWVQDDGSLGEYSNAKTFTTNANGNASFDKVKEGKYYIYETKAGSGYDLNAQRDYFPDSDDPNRFAGKKEYGYAVYLGTKTSKYNNITLTCNQYHSGKITIYKQDSENSTKIDGVGLKIYGVLTDGVTKGWLKSDLSLSENFSDAKEWKTKDGGKLTLNNLRRGHYYVYESTAAPGYDLEAQRIAYADSKDKDVGFAGNKQYGSMVYLGKIDGNYIAREKTYKQYPRKLTITKKDKDTGEVVQNVKVKVLVQANGKDGLYKKDTWGWLQSDGTIKSSMATINLGETGSKTIYKVPLGKYYVYETATGSEYYLEDQTGYKAKKPDGCNVTFFNENEEYALVKTSDFTDNKYLNLSIKATNRKGELTIIKKNGGDKLNGAEIKIYATGLKGGKTTSGWLKKNENKYEYVGYNDATTFTTGEVEKGEIILKGIEYGQYHIYETKAPEGYDITVQPGYHKKVDNAGQTSLGNNDWVYLGLASVNKGKSRVVNIEVSNLKPQITIHKTDLGSGENIENVGVKILVQLSQDAVYGGTTYKIGTWGWVKADGSISTAVNDAYTFVTDKEGNAIIKDIPYGTFYVYEVNTAKEYYLRDQSGYMSEKPLEYTGTFLNGEYAYLGSKVVANNAEEMSVTLEATNRKGELHITKIDEDYKEDLGLKEDLVLPRVEMKIYGTELDGDQTSGWLRKEENLYKYTTYEEATTFTTNDEGKIDLYGMKYGTYYVYETKAPEEYDIKKQDHYHEVQPGSKDLGEEDWAFLGKIDITNENNMINQTFSNKKVVELKGKVWEDVAPDVKNGASNNNIEDKDEQKIQGITVNLWNKKTGEKIATTTTNEQGEYIFNETTVNRKLSYWELAYSYVEFIYDNTKYITVSPFEGDDVSKNSKAQEKEVIQTGGERNKGQLYDGNLTGTVDPLPGRAVTYEGRNNAQTSELTKQSILANRDNKQDEKLLTSFFNADTYTIENINLGLMEKIEPTYTVGETLDYVKIVRGNYTFKYVYGDDAVYELASGGTGIQAPSTVPEVKLQNTSRSFTQKIYPSDIKYNYAIENSDKDKYKVYVVYKIYVKNTTNIYNEDVYSENGLYLDSLTNTYDTTRYELNNDDIGEGIRDEISRWTSSGNKATFNISGSNKKYEAGKGGIKGGETENTYIQFKVTDSALVDLVVKSKEELENIYKTAPTNAEIFGYHEYKRKDRNWVDWENNRNTKVYDHMSKSKDEHDGALGIKWSLFDTRTISGSVFEDGKVDNLNGEDRKDERVGNGTYDEGENKVQDVYVSLMAIDDGGNAEIARLYDNELIQSNGMWTTIPRLAVTKVDDNGNYSLKGVVPGKYYLKFTYGDGRIKYTDIEGNEISNDVGTTKGNEHQKIDSSYYKSTILTGKVKDATKVEINRSTTPVKTQITTSNDKWYLPDYKEENGNIIFSSSSNSIAVDYDGIYTDKNGNETSSESIINDRTTSDKEINYTSTQGKVLINAISPNMDVQFEYIADREMYLRASRDWSNKLINDCQNMCFGIIERPHVDLTLDKSISNIKITLSNGTTIINQNPSTQNISSSVRGLSESYSVVERSIDDLGGAEFEVKYELVVNNKSELDYANKDYYVIGDKGDSECVKTKITEIIDYTSSGEECTYKDNDKLYLVDEYDLYSSGVKYNKDEHYVPETNEYNKEYGQKILIPKDGELTPEKAGGKSSETYDITVTELINGREDNLGIENYSEIIGFVNSTFTKQYASREGNYKFGDDVDAPVGTNERDNAGCITQITPSTGENRSYTIYIVGVVMLVVIAGGIIVIKKFVI